MIRPLKAVITSNGLLNVSNHMKEVLGHDIKIENVKYFIRCINKNPITAFGYDIQGKDSKLYNHPHFSKHDMIRALDFWIEHWVYQNQCEAAFTDTVNVDHEITLKELILVREKVMKMPADTKFTRERIKEPVEGNDFEYNDLDTGKYYHFKAKYRQVTTNMSAEQIKAAEKKMKQKFPTTELPKMSEKVVFTQAVYCEDSSLDPFCHMVLELTPEEYIKYKNKPYTTGQIKYNFQENFRGGLFTNGIAAGMASTQESMEHLATAFNGIGPVTPSNGWTIIDTPRAPATPRFQIGDVVVWDRESNSFRRAIDSDPPVEHITLNPDTQPADLIQWITQGTYTITEDMGTMFAGDQITINNDFRGVTLAHGTVTEGLTPGDVIRLDGNGQWRKVSQITIRGLDDVISSSTEPIHPSLPRLNGVHFRTDEGPDHLLHSNLHPGIRDDTITYENMHLSFQDFGIETGDNSFVTVPVRFNGINNTEISTQIFVESGRNLYEISTFRTHRIQIRPALRNFLEIDGEEYYCVNMSISHNPSIPLSDMIFRDLVIESTNATAGRRITMGVDFIGTMGLTRIGISLTLDNPSGSGFMRTDIDDMNNRQWNLEILGNNRVRIGEDDFTVTEPIQINMR